MDGLRGEGEGGKVRSEGYGDERVSVRGVRE